MEAAVVASHVRAWETNLGGNQNDYPELQRQDELAAHIPVDPIDNDARNPQSPTRTSTGKPTAKRGHGNAFNAEYPTAKRKPKRTRAKQQ